MTSIRPNPKTVTSVEPIPRYYTPTPAAKTSLSRERIRQIETIAMRKFKRELAKRGLSRCDLIG
jgi:hypothetical protein